MNQSILPPELAGTMFVTGYRGIGKSFLAAQADLPSNIAFFDFESKGAGIDSQLHFGLYRALNQETSNPLEMYDLVFKLFSELEQDRYTVVILDNIAPLELAIGAEVSRNAKVYAEHSGMDASKIKRNVYGQGHACVNFLIDVLCALLHSRGIKLIIATSHIKRRWEGGQPLPNKYRIKGHDAWQNLSILTLILVPGSNPPVPAALVQKEQLGTITLDEQSLSATQITAMLKGDAGHTVARRLPRRIPDCTFQKIRWYLSNPADLGNPQDGEEPTFEERDPFDKGLSNEQLAFVTLAMQQQEREEAQNAPAPTINPQTLLAPQPTPEAASAMEKAQARVKELVQQGGDPDEIRTILRQESYPPPIIAGH